MSKVEAPVTDLGPLLYCSTMTEERKMTYVNRPEGEMDMMIGFFLVNGTCIAIVSRAIRLGEIDNLRRASGGNEYITEEKQLERMNGDEEQVDVQTVFPRRNVALDKSQQEEGGELRPKTSIIRQNLLGPLSFDDLHYT
ncbi:unnamed protein product [Angiostrongylus costaricensis]|uniref:Uncharacterized protein n=1 Tax=Angiostrongylus costaricensis TaxID=334426 RepID=A0A158PL87_ANGCS|nr:unnamed protein product [Angiostrongylus costaricensis]